MDYTNMTLDEKIKLIEQTDDALKCSTVYKMVIDSTENDSLAIIEKYYKFLSPAYLRNLSRLVKTRDYFDKVIDIIKDDLTNDDLFFYISSIHDYNKRLDCARKYIDKIDFNILQDYGSDLLRYPDPDDDSKENEMPSGINYEFLTELLDATNDKESISLLICAIDDVEKKLRFFNKYIDVFDSQDIAKIIGTIPNYNFRIELYSQYQDKIKDVDLPLLVTNFSRVSKSDIDDFFERFKDKLPNDSLTYEHIIMQNFSGFDLFEMLDKYIDKLDSQSISKLLKRNLSYISVNNKPHSNELSAVYIHGSRTEDPYYLVKCFEKYSKYLDNYEIGELICHINTYDKNTYRMFTYIETLYRFNPSFKELLHNMGEESTNKYLNILSNLDRDILINLFPVLADSNGRVDSEEKLYFVIEFVKKVMASNSSEIRRISNEVLREILKQPFERWEESFKQIEETFLKNNIPYVGKIYDIFDTLHPDSKEYVKKARSKNLKSLNSNKAISIVLFGDLLKCAIGSNNRSLKNYLIDIKNGNIILKNIIDNEIDIDLLRDDEKDILNHYLNHLNNLYNHTKAGLEKPRVMTNDLKRDSYELIQLFFKTNTSDFDIDDLPDRIVSMFTHFIGINKIDDLINCMNAELYIANERNIQRAMNNNFTLESGDFIKGLSGHRGKTDSVYLQYLTSILQNGNLCQEFLGDSSSHDMTPLDADVSRVPKLDNPYSVFSDSRIAASRYGPLWIVLKNDNKFNNTDENNKYLPNKLEIFNTGVTGEDHYGIRTGFPSSAIDFFVLQDLTKLNILKYEIVMNGFYIPIVNTKGELVFEPNEYFRLCENMQGLTYYGTQNDYKFAPELDNFNGNNQGYNVDVETSIKEVSNKRNLILDKLRAAGINVVLGRCDDLSNKSVELIDTGSTGRGTNKFNDYDFDFIMRVDRITYANSDEMQKLYDGIKKAFPTISFENNNSIRNQTVFLSDGSSAKIDITFISKTDKLDYSTDECIKDRLSNIKRLDSDKYVKVLQNIVLAKEVLKDCYKPKHAGQGKAQGGLGGVGVENWILQSGGSFERAARIFLSYAEGRDFEEFKKVYTVWDFGENHMADMKSKYKHDEFVSNNMDQHGYDKMKEVLKEYIRKLDEERTNEYSDETR